MTAPTSPRRVTEHPTHLIDRVRAGDPHALGQLYDEFAPRLLRVARQLLGSREDAEDTVHNMFVGPPEALQRYEECGSLRAWLTTRTVFVLRQIEDLSHPEIATLLGISEGNSRVRHTRALEHLRARITR